MKLFMTLCLLALAFNFTEATYSCYRSCGGATQDIEALFLGDNNFATSIINSFERNRYEFNDYSRYENEVKELLESDGLVQLKYSKVFEEELTSILEESWNNVSNTQTAHGNTYRSEKGSRINSVYESTHNTSGTDSTTLNTNGGGRFPSRGNSNQPKNCDTQCFDALTQIYQAHLSITDQLYEQYKHLFEQVASPRDCRKNQAQYQELYNQLCQIYPTPVQQSLVDYVDNQIARPYCRKGNMWDRQW